MNESRPTKAIAYLSEDRGFVEFSQSRPEHGVEIKVFANGFGHRDHGFHIHEYGDTSKGCESMGEHFNPRNCMHGGLISEVRHAGDLGNVFADVNGRIRQVFTARDISLYDTSPLNVVGRGIVIHENRDDLNLGNCPKSATTGESGARIACGTIQRLF